MIILLAMTMLFPPLTEAVSFKCGPSRSVKAEYKDAAMVFAGEVIFEEERKLSKVYRFKVEQWWKGEEKETLEVHVLKSKLSDGKYRFWAEQVRFQKGEKYLVYGFMGNNILVASGCTRTGTLISAQEDLKILGKGHLPKPAPKN